VSDDYLNDTIGLFEPTAPPVSRQPEEIEPADEQPKKRSRRFERRHPAYRFRIDPDDIERIKAKAGELDLAQDKVVAALVAAGLEAIDNGHLTFVPSTSAEAYQDAGGRARHRVVVEISWEWSC